MNDTVAIVVTYNRKELLRENIESLLKQTNKNFDIYIIDNASTDGTEKYIKNYIENDNIKYFNLETNLGGAGGFNYGIRKAVEADYKYIWVMDDDTIPYEDALEKLILADEKLDSNYGFLSSIVLWKDSTTCKMNKQKISKDWYSDGKYLKDTLIKTYYATFVSFFVRGEIVKKEGLPIKEFFIWGDDVEYTDRLSKNNKCYIVGNSQVLHKINNNEGSNIARDDENRINRYKYAYRNEMYIAKRNGIRGIIRQVCKIILHIIRVIVNSKNHKIKKIWIILKNSAIGIFFNPKIEYIN